MTINDLRSDIARTAGSQPARPVQADEKSAQSGAEARQPRRQDSVQISPEGLARLAEAGQAEGPPSGTLAPERLESVRQKIADGSYRTDAVAYAVAQNILGSGDV